MPSEALYRSLFESTPDSLVIIGPDGKITDVNRMAEDVTGVPLNELIGTDFSGYFTEPSNADKIYRRVFSLGSVRDYPLTIRHRSGRLTPVLYNAVLHKNDNNEILGVFATARNITELRRVEEALLDSEMRLRTLFVKAPIGIAIADENCRITDANEMACRMLGYTNEELCRLAISDITHPDDRSRFAVMSEDVVDGHWAGYNVEKRYLRKDGSFLWVRVTTSPVYCHDGRFLYGLGMFEDVTLRKKVEAEKEAQRNELIHVGRLGVMNELAASLAHEINQPLAAILSNTQSAIRLLEAETPDLAEIRETLEDILGDNRRISAVIREMRSFLQKDESHWENNDINQVISEILGLIHSDLVLRNVSIKTLLPADLPLIMGNRVQLQQVALNLIMNACEAVEENPPNNREISICSRFEESGTLTVEVSDNGCGFDKIPDSQILELFQTTKKKGLGLGLATCRSILETHGGKLTVRNRPDKGAVVSFSLPIRRDLS